MLLIIWWFLTIISWKIDSFLPKCLCCFQDDQFILQSSLVLCHCPGHCLMYLRKEIKQEIVLFFPTVNSFGMFAHKPLSYWVAGCFGTSSGLRSLHTQLVWSILPRVTVSSRDALHEHFSFFGWILSVWRECISCIPYHIQMEEFRNFVLIRTYFQKRFTLKERCRY